MFQIALLLACQTVHGIRFLRLAVLTPAPVGRHAGKLGTGAGRDKYLSGSIWTKVGVLPKGSIRIGMRRYWWNTRTLMSS